MLDISFKINGSDISLSVNENERLIDILRDRLQLTGTKEGCGQGECGACTVIMDGKAVNACLVPAFQVNSSEVITIEGLSNADGSPTPLQQAFIDAGAIQCGFCTPGMIVTAHVLLSRNPFPNDSEISSAFEGNLCRCTGYQKIIDAVHLAAEGAGK